MLFEFIYFKPFKPTNMDNLSFHITDITGNCVRAGATRIVLSIEEIKNKRIIRIMDNGCGMDRETLDRVSNPFYTSRTTRKVGLGIPFLIQNAEQTGGTVFITSAPGKGTEVVATFIASHIDCPPWGDLAGTVALLMTGNPDIDIHFFYRSENVDYAISSQAIREVLDGMPLSHPKVMPLVKDLIGANIGR